MLEQLPVNRIGFLVEEASVEEIVKTGKTWQDGEPVQKAEISADDENSLE